MTVLADVILPNRVIAAGVRGRQIRQNRRVEVDSGHEFINVGWTQTLREYEIGFIPMRREAWQDIEAIHEVTDGGAYGFLMEDPKDMRVDPPFGVMMELTASTFQLYKQYVESSSGRTKERKITRPRATGFVPMLAGVPLGGGAFTLDDETGIITIPSEPDVADLSWAGKFYVPVRFVSDVIDWELVATGPNVDGRFIAGPTCVLREIRE